MKTYDVSVIVPVHNGEKYIKSCYETIKQQTIEDLEIIFVENASSDNSYDVIKNVIAEDDDAKLYSESIPGAGNARNIGIRRANGKYVFFLDVDDKLPDSKSLTELFECSESHNSNVCGGRLLWFSDGTFNKEKTEAFPLNIKISNGENEFLYSDYQYDYGYYAFLYNRNFLLENKLFFPNYLRHQDPPFFVRTMVKSGIFYACNVDSYAYMSESTNKIMSYQIAKDIVKACKEELEIACENGLEHLAESVIDHLNGGNYSWNIAMSIDEDMLLVRDLVELDDFVKCVFPDLYNDSNRIQPLYKIANFPNLIKHRDELIIKKDEALIQKNESIDNLRGIISRKEEAIQKKNELIKQKRWLFPFEKVKKGSAVVIWGAGEVGVDYHTQVTLADYCKVVAWVDEKYQEKSKKVSSPEIVSGLKFDYIIVACSSENVRIDIIQKIEDMGIDRIKIIG